MEQARIVHWHNASYKVSLSFGNTEHRYTGAGRRLHNPSGALSRLLDHERIPRLYRELGEGNGVGARLQLLGREAHEDALVVYVNAALLGDRSPQIAQQGRRREV